MEYKSGFREDLAALAVQMNAGFQKMDARFEAVDKRLDGLDARLDLNYLRLDNKIDLKTNELRVEIRNSKIDTMKWIFAFFLAIFLGLVFGYLFKK